MKAAHEVQQMHVGVAMLGVEDGARDHGQAVAQARVGLVVASALHGLGVQGQQGTLHAGVFAHQQQVNAGVFKGFHCQALEGAPVVGHLRLAPAAVAHHVRQRSTVAVDATHPCAVVVHVGQAHAQVVKVGLHLAGHAGGGLAFGGGGRGLGVGVDREGHQQGLFGPQGLQVQIQHTGVVGQQGATAFALQHGPRIGTLQAEVFALALGVVVVVADAVFHPAAQATDAELAQQVWRLLEKQRQPRAGKGFVVAVDGAGGALHEVQAQAQVALKWLARRQPPRHGGQALQKRVDGLAVG